MKKLFIISNESIYENDNKYFCDNLDLKNISPINVPKSPIRQEILGRNKNIDILSNNHDECLKAIGVVYGVIMVIGAALTIVIAAVFGLIGVINITNDRVKEICPKSSLWPFVLTWVILIFANLILAKSKGKREDSNPISSLVCAMCQLIGLTIWGIIEIWFIASDCDQLHGKMIYRSAQIIVITYTVILSHIILGSIGVLCYNCYNYYSIKRSDQTTFNSNTNEEFGV